MNTHIIDSKSAADSIRKRVAHELHRPGLAVAPAGDNLVSGASFLRTEIKTDAIAIDFAAACAGGLDHYSDARRRGTDGPGRTLLEHARFAAEQRGKRAF